MTTATSTEFQDCTALLADGAALRAFAAEHGYLFFREFFPRELVLALRRKILEVLADEQLVRMDQDLTGWINPEVVDRFTLEDRGTAGVGVRDPIYVRVQKLEAFHALPQHPRLLAMYRELFQDEVLVHPRHIARLMVPGPHFHPTPMHQDFIHIQGTEQVWTAWMPIGDCPPELGGLSVLEGSHHAGLLPVREALGAGNTESWFCSLPGEWLTTSFLAGDVLTFPSLTVHQGLPPRFTDRVRLSCDYRFQPLHQPIEERSLLVHGALCEWDEVYREWTGDTPRYYWKDLQLELKPWDESVRWQKEKIC